MKTRRLDSIVEEVGLEDIDLIKIDVQGAEAAVLRGGAAAIRKARVLTVEVSLFDFYDQRSTFLDIETLLQPAGYSLYSIPFVSQNPMNGRTDWVEAIYVKNALLA